MGAGLGGRLKPRDTAGIGWWLGWVFVRPNEALISGQGPGAFATHEAGLGRLLLKAYQKLYQ